MIIRQSLHIGGFPMWCSEKLDWRTKKRRTGNLIKRYSNSIFFLTKLNAGYSAIIFGFLPPLKIGQILII